MTLNDEHFTVPFLYRTTGHKKSKLLKISNLLLFDGCPTRTRTLTDGTKNRCPDN
jgi:hypothetical protein